MTHMVHIKNGYVDIDTVEGAYEYLIEEAIKSGQNSRAIRALNLIHRKAKRIRNETKNINYK